NAPTEPAAGGFEFDFGELGSGFGDDAEDLAAGETAPAAASEPAVTEDLEPGDKQGKKNKKKRVDIGEILGGSLRLTGAYLHFDDLPAIFPAGDDALGVALGRITVIARAGKHVAFSVNGFVDLSRSLQGALGGAFASAGSTE